MPADPKTREMTTETDACLSHLTGTMSGDSGKFKNARRKSALYSIGVFVAIGTFITLSRFFHNATFSK
jgi:hypothetical protein